MREVWIKRVIGSSDYGGTRPVWVLCSDEQEYLLKFIDDGSECRGLSLINECLGYEIARRSFEKIPTPETVLVKIGEEDILLFEDAYRNGAIEEESLNYAARSIGRNLGIKKIPHAIKADTGFTRLFGDQLRSLDNYVMNRDRYRENPNILYSASEKEYFAIDFGLAMLEHRAVEAMEDGYFGDCQMPCMNCDASLGGGTRYLLETYKHLLQKTDTEHTEGIIGKILGQCPNEWEALKWKEKIIELIGYRMVNREIGKRKGCPHEIFPGGVS